MPEPRLRPELIPRHVAIIMDGNGRWAERRGISRIEGHRQGLEACRGVVRSAHELGIKTLTLYAFSLENWSRPKAEVDALMGLLDRYLDSELDEIDRNGIQVRTIGRVDLLPESTRALVAKAVERTRGNDEMTLVFALSYGGRQEIVDAAKKLLKDASHHRFGVRVAVRPVRAGVGPVRTGTARGRRCLGRYQQRSCDR